MVGANVGEVMEIPLYDISSENLFGENLDVTKDLGKSLEVVVLQ